MMAAMAPTKPSSPSEEEVERTFELMERRPAPPHETAFEGIWGDERNGGRAEPVRAHALGVFVEALFSCDETSTESLLSLLDQYRPGHKRGDFNEEDREMIRGTRHLIFSALMGLEDTQNAPWRRLVLAAVRALEKARKNPPGPDVGEGRRKILRILERAKADKYVRFRENRERRNRLPESPMAHDRFGDPMPASVDWPEIRLIITDLFGVHPSLCEHERFVEDLVADLRRPGSELSVPLAAAKLTVEANLFGDATKGATPAEAVRAVRRLFDSANK